LLVIDNKEGFCCCRCCCCRGSVAPPAPPRQAVSVSSYQQQQQQQQQQSSRQTHCPQQQRSHSDDRRISARVLCTASCQARVWGGTLAARFSCRVCCCCSSSSSDSCHIDVLSTSNDRTRIYRDNRKSRDINIIAQFTTTPYHKPQPRKHCPPDGHHPRQRNPEW
jgi:hypothetical protein